MEDYKKFINTGERIDDLERSGLKIIQNPSKFCFGMDAVLLSGFAKIKKGEIVADIGTGTGILPILLTSKSEGEKFIGIEIQENMADMARRSVAMNQLSDKIEIICKDINDISDVITASSIHVVVSNPPYMKSLSGIRNLADSVAIARHEIKCSLSDILRESSRMLRDGGKMYMVYRPHRLTELICEMRNYSLEAKRICMVHPFRKKPANMVLIEATKGGGVWMDVDPPIIVYERPGKYTKEICDIYGY